MSQKKVYSYTFTQQSHRKALWIYFTVAMVLFAARVAGILMFGHDFRVSSANALLFTGHILAIGLMIQMIRVKKRSVDITDSLEKHHHLDDDEI